MGQIKKQLIDNLEQDIKRPNSLINELDKQYIPGNVGFPPGSAQTYDPCEYKPGDSIRPSMTKQVTLGDYIKTQDWANGVKYDQNKPRMDLLDADFLEDVAKVLTFGAEKYEAHNWRKGISYSRLIAAAYRHLGAINRGEDIDPESGLPHSAHLGCCVMFLSSMMKNKPELDDRYKG